MPFSIATGGQIFVDDSTHTVIQICQHGREDSTLNVLDILEFFHVLIRGLKGAVHRIVGNEQKEGFVRVSLNEIDGFAGDGIGEIFLFPNGLASPDDGVVGIVVRFVAQVG